MTPGPRSLGRRGVHDGLELPSSLGGSYRLSMQHAKIAPLRLGTRRSYAVAAGLRRRPLRRWPGRGTMERFPDTPMSWAIMRGDAITASRPMGRFLGNITVIGLLLWLPCPPPLCADRDSGQALGGTVRRALESADEASIRQLFPPDHKVRVSLDRIAELQGFVGAGPIVEAFRRYLAGRTNIRFNLDDSGYGDRVRGTLCSRDKGGRREKVGLVFIFEKLGGVLRAVEVRETG